MSGLDSLAAGTVRRPVLLTVDDDIGIREIFALMFKDEMDVLEAENATEALAKADGPRIDVILLDVRMPGRDGIEIVAELKALQPDARVIFVTAVDSVVTAVSAMRLGAYDYLLKPFDTDALTALVRRALRPGMETIAVVGRDVGGAASLAVLAAARGVAVTIGDSAGARMIQGDSRALSDLYAELFPGLAPLSLVMSRVTGYVAAHYAHVSVERLAEAVGLSPARLSRVFHEEVAMTTKDYLTRVRVELARYFLRETHDTLEAIAERVGLCDAPHLSRIFRDRTGGTPGAYRLSVSKPDDARDR